jgi:tRNA dimethylallyltransferase
VRARWEAALAEVGPEELHRVLAQRDPEAARHILPTNGRRIVRALEVGEMTGQPFTAQLPVAGPELVAHLSIGLDLPRDVLDARISARVRRMFRTGLVDEVRGLLAQGLRESRTAGHALGYPQVIALLDGTIDQDEAEADIVLATRRFARRQQRWFRRDPRTVWLDADAPASSTACSVEALTARGARRLVP